MVSYPSYLVQPSQVRFHRSGFEPVAPCELLRQVLAKCHYDITSHLIWLNCPMNVTETWVRMSDSKYQERRVSRIIFTYVQFLLFWLLQLIRNEMQCHSVTVPQGHNVTVSQSHSATGSQCHSVTISQCHSATVPQGHSVTVSQGHSAPVSQCHRVSARFSLLYCNIYNLVVKRRSLIFFTTDGSVGEEGRGRKGGRGMEGEEWRGR